MVSAILLAIMISVPAEAASGSPADEASCLEVCDDASSTSAQRACLAREVESAEAELAEILKLAEAESAFEPDSDPDTETRATSDRYAAAIPATLAEAQSAWRRYIEADCTAVGAIWTNGSGRAPAVAACRLIRVRRRSLDLWLNYLEPGSSRARPRLLCGH